MVAANVVLALTLLCLLAPSASASTITLSTGSAPAFNGGTKNQGWWSDARIQDSTSDNYFAGFLSSTPNTSRAFFTFDLSGIGGSVTAATLNIRLGSTASPDPVETIRLFDVSTEAASLNSKGRLDPRIFEDLGTGADYGFADIVIGSPQGTIISISLNASALADINERRGGYFSVGATLVSLGQTTQDEFVFGFSQGFANQLVLSVVPEPGSASLVLVGCSLLGLSRRGTSLRIASVSR